MPDPVRGKADPDGAETPPLPDTHWRTPMGLDDKIKNKAEELTGKGKEAAGKATDNERLEGEGQTDQAKAGLKQTGEDIKDVFKK